MTRRIQWSLLLLVALGFVAPPAAASASGVSRSRAHSASVFHPAVGADHPDYAAPMVRQGVDLDARSEKAGGGLRRLLVGTASVPPLASGGSSRHRLDGHHGGGRVSSSATVALRAPPSPSV